MPTKHAAGVYAVADDRELTCVARIVSLLRRDLRCGHIPKEEGRMFATKRVRIMAAALTVAVAAGGTAAAVATSASASAKPAHVATHGLAHVHPKLSLKRFNLNGWVINAKYTLGRNTGNTFQQTYTASMVQGVPIKGPFVGTKFPPEDYVALPIGG